MKSIYIGVCKTRNDERFAQSFRNFTDSLVGHYSVCIEVVSDMFLPDAQNKITKNFMNCGYDYLLLLDDDHWGHTKEMLDTLIGANAFVATIKTYSRHYPYSCAAWKYVGHKVIMPIENGEGYQECDLTGFPMTLISRETFSALEQPYFRPYEADGRTWNSDIDLFERLAIKNIKPIACFQHCLNHDKITQDNVHQYRADERHHNNNIAWFHILQEQYEKDLASKKGVRV